MEYGQIYGIKVITEKAERTSINLLMQDANAADSGFYNCVPNNAPASKIKVHILTGERESQNKGRHSDFVHPLPVPKFTNTSGNP